MKHYTVYGIKNCDTMKKAFLWLDKHKVAYVFHDYKKNGADEELLDCVITEYGWEAVLNRKGTTWRGLPDKTKAAMNDKLAHEIAMKNPSIIRRPLITDGKKAYFGFDTEEYKKIFAA